MCQEKKEEEDSPGLKIASIRQYEELRITLKSAKKYKIQRLKQHKDEQNNNKKETKNAKKNNCVDISSNKQVKSHTRRPGND